MKVREGTRPPPLSRPAQVVFEQDVCGISVLRSCVLFPPHYWSDTLASSPGVFVFVIWKATFKIEWTNLHLLNHHPGIWTTQSYSPSTAFTHWAILSDTATFFCGALDTVIEQELWKQNQKLRKKCHHKVWTYNLENFSIVFYQPKLQCMRADALKHTDEYMFWQRPSKFVLRFEPTNLGTLKHPTTKRSKGTSWGTPQGLNTHTWGL